MKFFSDNKKFNNRKRSIIIVQAINLLFLKKNKEIAKKI